MFLGFFKSVIALGVWRGGLCACLFGFFPQTLIWYNRFENPNKRFNKDGFFISSFRTSTLLSLKKEGYHWISSTIRKYYL